MTLHPQTEEYGYIGPAHLSSLEAALGFDHRLDAHRESMVRVRQQRERSIDQLCPSGLCRQSYDPVQDMVLFSAGPSSCPTCS